MKKFLLFILPLVGIFLSLSTPSSYAAIDLEDKTANNLKASTFLSDPSLQAYYKLENTSDSKGSNTLTNNNSVSFTAAKFNNGADLGSSNTNKYLSSTSSLGYDGGPYTISLWVKLNTEITSGNYTLVNVVDGNTHTQLNFIYQYNGGTRQLRGGRGRLGVSDDGSAANVNLGTSSFHHLVLTYDGTNTKAYLDNNLFLGPNASTGNGSGAEPSGVTIGINHNDFSSNPSSAIFEDVALFNRALDPTEINSLYTSGVEAGSTKNDIEANFLNDPHLQALYKLEDLADAKHGLSLTNTNSVAFNPGKYNNAADTGTSDADKILSANSNFNYTGGAYSISFWAKRNTGSGTIFNLNNSATKTSLMVDWDGTNLNFQRVKWAVGGDGGSYNVALDTNWHHYTIAYDGTYIRGYFDGSLVVGPVAASGNGINDFGNKLLLFGQVNDLTANNWLGQIDDMALFDRNLNATEVSSIYNSTSDIGTTEDSPFSASSKAVGLSGYQYLSAPDSGSLSITSKATLEFWVKFNSLPASGQTVYMLNKRDDNGSDGGYGFGLRNSSGTLQLVGYANQSADSSNRDVYKWDWTPSTNTWYHLALTIDSTQSSANTFKLFVDGSSQGHGDALISNNISSIRDADSPLLIGCELQAGVTANCANAKFDDVRIWNGIRTDSEIDDNKSIELTGRETDFAAYYPMEPLN